MTSDDRRTATDATGAACVDILRDAVNLGHQGSSALLLWVIGNDVPDGHGWPLRIDWPARTITYWPDATNPDAGNGAITLPLKRVPLAPLWRILADHGGLWCANPTHRSPEGTVCPHRVNARGEHTTDNPRDPQLCSKQPFPHPDTPERVGSPRPDHHLTDAPLELAITRTLQRAAPGCEHPDPGQPIYDHTRACAACGAAAILELFHTAETLELFRRRHTDPTQPQPLSAGYWEAGQGHQHPGHPPGFRPAGQ
jgi:hypothetical protein